MQNLIHQKQIRGLVSDLNTLSGDIQAIQSLGGLITGDTYLSGNFYITGDVSVTGEVGANTVSGRAAAFSRSLQINGNVFSTIQSIVSGVSGVVDQTNTGLYRAVSYDLVAYSGANNVRHSKVVATWPVSGSGTSVNWAEWGNVDIGNTSALTYSGNLGNSGFSLYANVPNGENWEIRGSKAAFSLSGFSTNTELFYKLSGAVGGGGGTGENNTASNVGVGGVGLFKQKDGVTLQFKNISSGSAKVTIVDDAGNNEVDVDVDETAINHDNLSGFESNEHIDHSSVSLLTPATGGLKGGGDITSTRTLQVNWTGMDRVTGLSSGDLFALWSSNNSEMRAVSKFDLQSGLNTNRRKIETNNTVGSTLVWNFDRPVAYIQQTGTITGMTVSNVVESGYSYGAQYHITANGDSITWPTGIFKYTDDTAPELTSGAVNVVSAIYADGYIFINKLYERPE